MEGNDWQSTKLVSAKKVNNYEKAQYHAATTRYLSDEKISKNSLVLLIDGRN